MNKISIRNSFTGKEIIVDASKPLTIEKINAWRRKLHAADCKSGDTLGGRGVQSDEDAYASLLYRAERLVATGAV